MATTLAELLDLLDLEVLEVDLYRGRAGLTTRQRTFGGQVAGQALVAAVRTVEPERRVHSLHAYFLRPGDSTKPIVYEVDRIRDGRSFTTRRVVARQHGQAIFNLSASFQVEEPGLEHQDPMPAAPDPDSLPSLRDRGSIGSERAQEWAAIDLRWPERTAESPTDRQQVWLRSADRLPDEPEVIHVCVLTYISDLTLLGTALTPHRQALGDGELQMASLDHAMWFHRPFRADEWLLYDQASPSASNSRGLATGRIFDRDGALVASVVQEGLIRVRKPR